MVTIGSLTVPRQSATKMQPNRISLIPRATGQGFGLATSSPAFNDSIVHGLLGLGFQSIATAGQTFVGNLFQAGKIPRIVAAHLTRFPDTLSSLTLGGIDAGNFVGSLTYFPVVEQGLVSRFIARSPPSTHYTSFDATTHS